MLTLPLLAVTEISYLLGLLLLGAVPTILDPLMDNHPILASPACAGAMVILVALFTSSKKLIASPLEKVPIYELLSVQ